MGKTKKLVDFYFPVAETDKLNSISIEYHCERTELVLSRSHITKALRLEKQMKICSGVFARWVETMSERFSPHTVLTIFIPF